MIKILRLQDSNDKNINHSSVIITDLKYYQLETEIKKIINEFEKEGFWAGAMKMFLKNLKKREKLKLHHQKKLLSIVKNFEEKGYFLTGFLFLFLLICLWTHYKDPEGFSLLGKLINLIYSLF